MRALDLDTLDQRREMIGLTVKECSDVTGVPYMRLWRALRPSLRPDEVQRLNALIESQERHYRRSA
jgi:hypothetical protein